MPSDSIGFCVAITMNGNGTSYVVPPIVTCCSCMTSSSADWTLAGARLISSASRKLQNTGPSSVSNEAGVGSVHARADEVGGDQVGGELDPAVGTAEYRREGLDGECLGQSGDSFEQDVAAGEQADQQPLEHRVLPDDHAFDLVKRLSQRCACLAAQLVRIVDVSHLFLLSAHDLDQSPEPRERRGAAEQQQGEAAAGKGGGDLMLDLLVPELGAEVLVDRVQTLRVGGGERLAVRHAGDLRELLPGPAAPAP